MGTQITVNVTLERHALPERPAADRHLQRRRLPQGVRARGEVPRAQSRAGALHGEGHGRQAGPAARDHLLLQPAACEKDCEHNLGAK